MLSTPLPFPAFSPLPGGRVYPDVTRYGVVENSRESRTCVSRCTPREPLCHDFPFPLAYFLSCEVGQRPTAEPRQNVDLDGVFVVGKRSRFQVLSWVPLVNPIDKRYPTGARINVRSVVG